MWAPRSPLHVLDHGLGDWLTVPASDDNLYASGHGLDSDALTGTVHCMERMHDCCHGESANCLPRAMPQVPTAGHWMSLMMKLC